jgi:hypothetical protein
MKSRLPRKFAHHDGRSSCLGLSAAPAFSHVWTPSFFADRVKTQTSKVSLDPFKLVANWDLRLEPFG